MNDEDGVDAYRMYRLLFDGFDSEEVARFFMEHSYWPDTYRPKGAAARVRACNNPEKGEYWKLAELVAWALHSGREHVLLYWMCDVLSFDRPARSDDQEVQALRDELAAIEQRRLGILTELSERVGNERRLVQTGARFQRNGEETDG